MSETVHDLGALRALREVGRHGSIAAAAAVLGVTQQALSAPVRDPEGGTGHAPAAARLEAALRSIRSGVSHRLAIAASQTIAEHLVPHWLVELRGIEQADAERSPDNTPTVVELT